MNFAKPEIFLLTIPWFLLCIVIFINQKIAFAWLKKNISRRFIKHFTVYTGFKMFLHILLFFLMGCALIFSLTQPYRYGKVEGQRPQKNIFLILDASYSMYAIDGGKTYQNTDPKLSRFDAAKFLAKQFIDKLPSDKIGLFSFSGQTVVHTHPTLDHKTLTSLVDKIKIHMIRHTGSNFTNVLNQLISAIHKSNTQNVAIIISDGEPLPEKQDFSEQLDALKVAKVPVYTIGVGLESGGSVYIYDPVDVIKFVEKPKTAKTIQTYRSNKILKDISETTNGKYYPAESSRVVTGIVNHIQSLPENVGNLDRHFKGRIDLSHYGLLLFLILFFIEMIYLFPAKPHFTLWLFVFFLIHCNPQTYQAHRENEKGIEKYDFSLFEAATPHFERSVLYRSYEEIPLFNLGLNAMEDGDEHMAHQYFQEAILAHPDFAEAYFNDGVALFLRAEKLLDPQGCYLANSAKLYDMAIERFEKAQDLGIPSENNIQYIKKRIRDLYELNATAKDCPPQQNQSQSSYRSKHAPPPPPQQQQQQQSQQNQNNQNSQSKQNQQQNQQQNQKQQNQNQQQHQDQNSQNNQDQQQNQQPQNQPKQKPKLTEKEESDVQKELERIKKESEEADDFRQTKAEQVPGSEKEIDENLYW